MILKLFTKEMNIFRIIYIKVLNKELLSVYTYGDNHMFGIQIFDKKII